MIRKVAVRGAAPGSGISFFETEIDDKSKLVLKEYTATPTTLLPLTSLTVTKPDGTDVVITGLSGGTTQALLAPILNAKMKELGYTFSEDFNLDKGFPSVTVSGEKLTIISELTFKSMAAASGSPNFTAKSSYKGISDFTKTTGSTTNPTVITVNGTARSDAHAWTYGTTSTATVKGYIETALATEISAGTVTSVTVTDTGTQYKIVIVANVGTTIALNGSYFTESGVRTLWY